MCRTIAGLFWTQAYFVKPYYNLLESRTIPLKVKVHTCVTTVLTTRRDDTEMIDEI